MHACMEGKGNVSIVDTVCSNMNGGMQRKRKESRG